MFAVLFGRKGGNKLCVVLLLNDDIIRTNRNMLRLGYIQHIKPANAEWNGNPKVARVTEQCACE